MTLETAVQPKKTREVKECDEFVDRRWLPRFDFDVTTERPEPCQLLFLTGFHQFNLNIPVRFASAGTHFKPIADLLLQLSLRLVSRRSGHSNRAYVWAGVLRDPGASPVGNLTDKLHPIQKYPILCVRPPATYPEELPIL